MIGPIWVSRGCFELNQHHAQQHNHPQQVNVANELECVTNGTLSNIIRQLSSLSRHAEDLFGSILQDTTKLVQRSVSLKERLDVLTQKVEVLSDAGGAEQQPGGTIGRKPYRSKAEHFDQQIVARDSMPVSLKEVYERCDPPPCLSKLNDFREDGLDGVKLYTNPNYFFDLWSKEMLSGKTKASKKGKWPLFFFRLLLLYSYLFFIFPFLLSLSPNFRPSSLLSFFSNLIVFLSAFRSLPLCYLLQILTPNRLPKSQNRLAQQHPVRDINQSTPARQCRQTFIIMSSNSKQHSTRHI